MLLPGEAGSWDSASAKVSKPIVSGGQILAHYTGTDLPSKGVFSDHPLRHLAVGPDHGPGRSSIGLATARFDGFLSLDGYDPPGTLVTVPLRFSGNRLMLNVRAPHYPFGPAGDEQSTGAPWGWLRVAIRDAEGRPIAGLGFEDCDSVTGDHLHYLVSWRGSIDLSRLGRRPVQLCFELKNAALYAFQFRGSVEPPASMNLLEPGARGRPT